MTAVDIEVKGWAFRGIVRDETLVGISTFCDELDALYNSLSGTATLASYENLKLVAEGDGRGAVSVKVEVYGSHLPLSKLCFDMRFDQTFLPKIISDMQREFPEG
ncbi:MAG: hypothetical protein ACE363_16105 [Alphaproteobacteria bacterium]